MIANIPIRVSAKAVFARYNICPIDDINFGSIVLNNRKQTCFTIQNKGEFEFKYCISKQLTAAEQRIKTQNMAAAAAKNRVKSRERVTSPVSRTAQRSHSKKLEGPARYSTV